MADLKITSVRIHNPTGLADPIKARALWKKGQPPLPAKVLVEIEGKGALSFRLDDLTQLLNKASFGPSALKPTASKHIQSILNIRESSDPQINKELAMAGQMTVRAIKTLELAGKKELAETLSILYSRVLPQLVSARQGNPIHHTAQVVEFMVEIALGEGVSDGVVKNAVAAALFHDIGFAEIEVGKIRKADIDDVADPDEKAALRERAIQSRQAHMQAGSKIVAEILAEYPDRFSREDSRLIQGAVEIHDNPSIQEYEDINRGRWLFKPDNLIMKFLREADRLWMLSNEGIEVDLAREVKKGKERKPLKQVEGNIKRQLEEWALYAEAFDAASLAAYGFKGASLYRTLTGYRLFARLIAEQCLLYPALIPTFFRTIVEPLGDSFEPDDREVYYQIFPQIIELVRRSGREADEIDKLLTRFGIGSAKDYLKYNAQARSNKSRIPSDNKIKKILIPSRVTVGGDIEVTALIVENCLAAFPGAEIFLLGSGVLKGLIDHERVKVEELNYPRSGTFVGRLDQWRHLVAKTEENLRGLRQDEFIIIDPDSRITQLGLLPLIAGGGNSYYLFESSFSDDRRCSFREDLTKWLGQILPAAIQVIGEPKIRLSRTNEEFAVEMIAGKGLEKGRFVAVNLGTAGHKNKALEAGTEKEIILSLVDMGLKVFLDKGAGEEEGEKVLSLLAGLPPDKIKNVIVPDKALSLGQFAALVQLSGYYVGYDSMGAHLADVSQIPASIIFKGYNSKNIPIRWYQFNAQTSLNKIDLEESRIEENSVIRLIRAHILRMPISRSIE